MTSNIKINPERLKQLLNATRLSQKDLASRIGVDTGTVSRWARGATRKLRRGTFNKLRDALGASEADLCGEGPLPDPAGKREALPSGQVSFVIDDACRNALALIARRYGVSQRRIVEIAPLLFFIIAEQSLAERSRILDAFEAAHIDAENKAPPHMKGQLVFPHDQDDLDLIDRERKSIEARDLFARESRSTYDDPEAANPLASYLDGLLASTKALCGAVGAKGRRVLWGEREEPRYLVGIEELDELLGGDETAMRLVLKGRVALAEMPGEVRKASKERKAEWVKADWEKTLSTSPDISDDDFYAAIGIASRQFEDDEEEEL